MILIGYYGGCGGRTIMGCIRLADGTVLGICDVSGEDSSDEKCKEFLENLQNATKQLQDFQRDYEKEINRAHGLEEEISRISKRMEGLSNRWNTLARKLERLKEKLKKSESDSDRQKIQEKIDAASGEMEQITSEMKTTDKKVRALHEEFDSLTTTLDDRWTLHILEIEKMLKRDLQWEQMAYDSCTASSG